MSTGPGPGGPEPGSEPTEEEIRALEELRRVTVDQVILQVSVSLIHLAGVRMGLAPGAEAERDLGQVRKAIDAVRALLPLVEATEGGPDLAPIRNALSQLQMAYAAEAGQGSPAPPPSSDFAATARERKEKAEGPPGPARPSGRRWTPGQ
ncbi:MAG: hypothetical protein ACR2ML_01815 [Solirubrobacteraceae bacterium]